MRHVATQMLADPDAWRTGPHFAPRRRLDETLAARKPVLAFKDSEAA
jgi:glycine dehydrogenase subunit 2